MNCCPHQYNVRLELVPRCPLAMVKMIDVKMRRGRG